MTLAAEAPILVLFRRDLMGKRKGEAVLSMEIALPVSESAGSRNNCECSRISALTEGAEDGVLAIACYSPPAGITRQVGQPLKQRLS